MPMNIPSEDWTIRQIEQQRSLFWQQPMFCWEPTALHSNKTKAFVKKFLGNVKPKFFVVTASLN